MYALSCFIANGLFDVEYYMLSHLQKAFAVLFDPQGEYCVATSDQDSGFIQEKKDIARKNATIDGCNLIRNDPAYLVFRMFLIAITGCFLITQLSF